MANGHFKPVPGISLFFGCYVDSWRLWGIWIFKRWLISVSKVATPEIAYVRADVVKDAVADGQNEILAQFDPSAVGSTDLHTWIQSQVASYEETKAALGQLVLWTDKLIAAARPPDWTGGEFGKALENARRCSK